MIDFILGLSPQVIYAGVYIGIIFTGGVTLLPAMLYALSGYLDMKLVFVVAIAAALTADSLWYMVGRAAKEKRIYSLPFVRRRMTEARQFSYFFRKHGVLLVFVTKFIWGTRIASHVLAGVHRISFWKFALSTMSGTAVWFSMFYFLLRSVDAGIAAAKATALRIELICLIFVVVAILLNWLTGKYLRKKLMNK